MKTLMNRVQLIGQPGNDPEIKSLENGNKVSNFDLATNENYKNGKGDKVTDTQWHRIVVWGPLADFTEKFVRKGEKIGLEGRLITRNYEGKDGNKKYVTEVVAHEIQLLHPKTA